MGKKPQRKLPSTRIRAAAPVETVYVNPLFNTVLVTLLILFTGLVGLAVWISNDDAPNDLRKQLFTFCFNGGELILGAIVGLLGGKGIDSFAQKIETPK